MGLFDRKKTNFYESQPLYTLGNSKTVLVVGLGNIGRDYAHNRHNIGFMAIDEYRQTHDLSDWVEKKDLQAYYSSGDVGSTRVILAKPTTMMNNSGDALQKLQQFYKIDDEDVVILYDELDVPYGSLRTRTGGGHAGHNGIKSLIAHSRGAFGRIRIGIGPKTHAQMDSADYVLQDFSEQQHGHLAKVLRQVCALVDERTVGPLPDQTINVVSES